jgi:type I restriction enzyme M protein
MARGKGNNSTNNKGATLGFEATLWAAADKLRNNMDAAEHKHVVLGPFFSSILRCFSVKARTVAQAKGEWSCIR